MAWKAYYPSCKFFSGEWDFMNERIFTRSWQIEEDSATTNEVSGWAVGGWESPEVGSESSIWEID